MKKSFILGMSILCGSLLYGCSDNVISNPSTSEVKISNTVNNSVLDLNGVPVSDIVLDGKLEFMGLKVFERVKVSSYEDRLNVKMTEDSFSAEYVRVYKDTSTGCQYMIDHDDIWLPVYGIDGEVEGCYNNSANISVEDSKGEMLKLLKGHYSDKDNDELEYILENIFDYPNLSIEELKSKLNLLGTKYEDLKDENLEDTNSNNDSTK